MLLTYSVLIQENNNITINFIKKDPFILGAFIIAFANLLQYLEKTPNNYNITHDTIVMW